MILTGTFKYDTDKLAFSIKHDGNDIRKYGCSIVFKEQSDYELEIENHEGPTGQSGCLWFDNDNDEEHFLILKGVSLDVDKI